MFCILCVYGSAQGACFNKPCDSYLYNAFDFMCLGATEAYVKVFVDVDNSYYFFRKPSGNKVIYPRIA